MDKPLRVSDIMTKDVVALVEEDNLSSVARSLERYRFRHLPVVDGRRLVGMVSQRDLLKCTVSGVDPSPVAKTRERAFVEQTFVRDLMQTEVLTIAPEDSVEEAARRMVRYRIGALPVTTPSGELLGIVTGHDVLSLIARRELAPQETV
jgi:acetoin utilization protein AcuB